MTPLSFFVLEIGHFNLWKLIFIMFYFIFFITSPIHCFYYYFYFQLLYQLRTKVRIIFKWYNTLHLCYFIYSCTLLTHHLSLSYFIFSQLTYSILSPTLFSINLTHQMYFFYPIIAGTFSFSVCPIKIVNFYLWKVLSNSLPIYINLFTTYTIRVHH